MNRPRKLKHVPFNGASPALTSTIGGHTPIVFAALPGAVSTIKDGQLRALAMTEASVLKHCPMCRHPAATKRAKTAKPTKVSSLQNSASVQP
jgi:hypothetical protein